MIVSPHVPGYPFIDPGPVGGVGTNTSLVPDFELYLRWWQLATFLPMVHFLTPPSVYSEESLVDIDTVSQSLKHIRTRQDSHENSLREYRYLHQTTGV